MSTPLGGARSSSASKGKVKTWVNEYEKLGVAMTNHVRRCSAEDAGTFIVKDEIGMLENAMRGCATHVVSERARSAFGLPALVINDMVTQTWGYPGIEPGDPITVEYEGVRAWREDGDPRIVFMSKEFLENRTLNHAGAGVFTSFLSKKSATATVSEYAPATLEVTEPLNSALLIFTGDTQIRLSTSGRLRGKYKKY